MATSTLISLEEYLHTSYEPDAEYVDGEVEERNVGEYDHSTLQGALLFWFYEHKREWRVRSVVEQRTLLSPRRVRIPDVSVFSEICPLSRSLLIPN